MNAVTQGAFLLRIKTLTGIAFQDFLNELYTAAYGSSFVSIKQKRDKGCDGILNGNTILAAYAPEKYELRTFKKKYGEDFDSYKQNWSSTHSNWQVVYNGELQANGAQYLTELKADVQIIQRGQIVAIVASLPWEKKRSLAAYLKVDDQFLINDALEEIIDDLSKEVAPSSIVYAKPLYMPDKVALNFTRIEADTILAEYESYMEYFISLKGLLTADGERVGNLKSKICRDYVGHSGSCNERLTAMTEEYAGKKVGDDWYQKMIRVVLVYFFEQCLIGEKTPHESHA